MSGAGDRDLAALLTAIDGLRQEVRATRREVSRLRTGLADLDAHLGRLRALGDDGSDPGVRLDRLAEILDVARIARHIEAAVERASVADVPVPHVVIDGVLPADAYQAVIDGVPPRPFFNDVGGGLMELPVPPAIAPVQDVVLWRLLTGVIAGVLARALALRFAPLIDAPIPLGATQSRLLLRLPGFALDSRRKRPRDLLTVFMLARPGQHGDCSIIGSIDAGDRKTISYTANTALVVRDAGGAHAYAAIPAAADGEWATWQFSLGPEGGDGATTWE